MKGEISFNALADLAGLGPTEGPGEPMDRACWLCSGRPRNGLCPIPFNRLSPTHSDTKRNYWLLLIFLSALAVFLVGQKEEKR